MSDFNDFISSLADADFAEVEAKIVGTHAEEIQKAAHVVNGGESLRPCIKCNGTGTFRGYARNFNCYTCKGSGNVSKGTAAAHKGQITAKANRAKWLDDNAALHARMNKHSWNRIITSMLQQVVSEGKTLSVRQIEVATEIVDKADAKDIERAETRKIETNTKSGAVDVSAIQALFATATNNDIKRPIFRADGLTIKLARNGALYVTDESDTYLGKIVEGTFHARWEATAETLAQLQAIAIDPAAEAIKYGRRTGTCGCCGRGLVDPISIRSGIGPICASKWGFNHLRDMAVDSLADDDKVEKANRVVQTPVATPAGTSLPVKQGTKMFQVFQICERGARIAEIARMVGVSESAARALISDLRRKGFNVVRSDETFFKIGE